MTQKKCFPCVIAGVLTIIGAINWGILAIFKFDLVTKIFGYTTISRVIFIVIGVAGVISLLSLLKCCPGCKKCCDKTT